MGKKDKVFRFRILEKTRRSLSDDLETIVEDKEYYLYKKVPWFLGSWLEVYPQEYDGDYFLSFEDAQRRAFEVAEDEKHYRIHYRIEKKLKQQLKTTVKIVDDFSTPVEP